MTAAQMVACPTGGALLDDRLCTIMMQFRLANNIAHLFSFGLSCALAHKGSIKDIWSNNPAVCVCIELPQM